MSVTVSVVVPAYNEEKHIRDCLNSLVQQRTDSSINCEIITVDNNSTDSTAEIIKDFESIIYLFKEKGPVGSVRNFGVQRATGDYIAFIDSDCVVDPHWIQRGYELAKTRRAVFGGRCDVPESASWIEKYWLLGVRESLISQRDLIGSSIFISRSDFELAGGFDETISSGEDTKLTETLRDSRTEVIITSALNVIHLGNAKTVMQFINRQAWHSENYFINIKRSMRDPTFWLTCIFLFLFLSSPILLAIQSYGLSLVSIITAALVPNALSIKRLSRATPSLNNLTNYHKIYLLDLLYLLGRVKGLYLGAKKRLFS